MELPEVLLFKEKFYSAANLGSRVRFRFSTIRMTACAAILICFAHPWNVFRLFDLPLVPHTQRSAFQ